MLSREIITRVHSDALKYGFLLSVSVKKIVAHESVMDFHTFLAL